MRRGLAVVLFLTLLLGAGVAQAAELSVRVLVVDLEGASVALGSHEVALETWRIVPGPKAERELESVYHVRTNPEGVARFDVPYQATGEERLVTLVYDGLTYMSESVQTTTRELELRVYEARADAERLSGNMTLGLDVRDGFVIVDTRLVLTHPERFALDTGREGRGLRVPLALPAVGEVPWEAGVIPSETGPRHVSLRQTPEQGRFQFRDGAVFYEGAIFPGQPFTIQVRYALPIIEERQDLALTMPVDLDQLTVTTTWTDRVAPRVVPDREFLAVGRKPGESVQGFMRIEGPPKAGEAFVLRVDRLPRPYAVRNQFAVGGGVLLLVLFGLSLVALRRRDV